MGESSGQNLEVNLAKLEQANELASSFACGICIEPMSLTEKYKSRNYCMLHSFCTDCFAKYIQTKLEDGVANIKCPAVDCKQLLDPLECQTIISLQLFNKWCDLLCESSVLVYDRCYCPYQNCSALILNECGGSVKRSECPNCKRFFCYKCKIAWHAGYWCSESRQRRDANDVKFGELVETFKWTRCPSCGQAVERMDGCRFVICRCGNKFCHKCGKKCHLGRCDGHERLPVDHETQVLLIVHRNNLIVTR